MTFEKTLFYQTAFHFCLISQSVDRIRSSKVFDDRILFCRGNSQKNQTKTKTAMLFVRCAPINKGPVDIFLLYLPSHIIDFYL